MLNRYFIVGSLKTPQIGIGVYLFVCEIGSHLLKSKAIGIQKSSNATASHLGEILW